MIKLLSDDIEDLIDEYIEQIEHAADAKRTLQKVARTRIAIILKLAEHGMSQAEISRKLGISHQRVHQLITRGLEYNNE